MPAPNLNNSNRKIAAADERREAARMKAYAEAWADPGGMEPAVPCRIIDISRNGAKIECSVELPDSFTLHVGANKYAAQAIWRRQQQMGVEFRKAAKALKASQAGRR